MTTAMPDGLFAYLADREQQRADDAKARLDALTPREQWLVREAAVMGWVQGVRSVPGSHNQQIPHDRDIVQIVMQAVGSFTDLYPLLAGSTRDLVRKIVRANRSVRYGDLVAAAATLAGVDRTDVLVAIQDLIADEELSNVNDEIREV